VWKDKSVFAIDTKGGHLLSEAADRKLLRIDAPSKSSVRVKVRLVSEGHWNLAAERVDDDGYTVWSVKEGGTRRVTPVEDLPAVLNRAQAVDAALLRGKGCVESARRWLPHVIFSRCTVDNFPMRKPDAGSNASTGGSLTSTYNWTTSPEPKNNEERLAGQEALPTETGSNG
jgi:hypothetical protein